MGSALCDQNKRFGCSHTFLLRCIITIFELGERIRVYKCCSRIEGEGEGCDRGPHVFLETDPQVLHLRHAFSNTRPPYERDKETALVMPKLGRNSGWRIRHRAFNQMPRLTLRAMDHGGREVKGFRSPSENWHTSSLTDGH